MFDQAGVIFTGQVVAVRRVNAASDATGAIEIDFVVDTDGAIRGVANGSLYTLREWAGLAPAGNLPFQPGQRYLMLLHTAGPSGLSSPVGGPDGAIPIRGSGPAAGPNTPDLGASDLGATNSSNLTAVPGRSPAHTTFKSATSAALPAPVNIADNSTNSRTVDLRWIATRVLQPLAYLTDSAAVSVSRPVAERASVTAPHSTQNASLAIQPDTASPTDAISALSQSADYAVVLALLQSWEQDDHAAL